MNIKEKIKSLVTTAFLIICSNSYGQGEFPNFKGPYMGQKPPAPNMPAKLFAPGIISKETWDLEGVFAPGMKEFYFTSNHGNPIIIGFRQENNVWKKFTEFPRTGEIVFSPDGNRMHMASGYKDRIADGWSESKSLGKPYEDMPIMRLSSSSKQTYFFDEATREGNGSIRYSRLINGKREQPKLLSQEINTGKWTAHPFIAADESYLIWDSEREGGFGKPDLYISFKQKNGSWGKAINMGPKVNSDKEDFFATVTPDGKYIMFNRTISWEPLNVDIYWVDAKIIEELRQKNNSHD